MKKYKILGLVGMIFGMIFGSCYKDLGNYNYHDINEVSIADVYFTDTTYELRSFVDTLRISPQIENSIIQDVDNYEFRWMAVGNRFQLGGTWEIGTQKDLVYPLNLPEQDYTIYLHIKDKKTDIVTTKSVGLTLTTMFSKGWLLWGENEQGRAQLDMLVETAEDTIMMKDILKESGLPALQKPTFLFVPFTGLTENCIQIGTELGTYKLDRDKLVPIEDSHLKYSFWDISSAGNCVLQDANQLFMFRVEIIDGNLYFDRDRMVGKYNKIGNPSNHYKGDYKLFRVGNKIGYNLHLMARNYPVIVCYDDDAKQFVYQGGVNQYNGIEGYCEPIPAVLGNDTWKPGLDFVTTINSRNARISNYTILKKRNASSSSDYYLYAYQISGTFSSVSFTMRMQPQQMTNAEDIQNAKFYASSMNKPYIFYTVGSKLYGYDCYKCSSTLLLDFSGKNMYEENGEKMAEVITAMWSEQYLLPPGGMKDEFYIALYDPKKPASSGGRIVGYRVVDNANVIQLEEIPGTSRSGLCKVVSMAYKAQ